jgi:Tfp pilus assembly protein PilO
VKTISLAPPVLVAVLAAVGVLVLGAGWFAVVAPQRHDAASAAAQVNRTKSQIEQLEKAASTQAAGGTARQPAIRTADLYRITKAMPSTEDQPDLLLELDQVARAAGVDVVTIEPQAAHAADTYTTVPIDLSVTGDFYALTDLLYRLRALVAVRHGALDATGRLFAVSSLALSPVGTGKTLNANLTVDAFVYGTADVTSTTASTTTSTSTTSTDATSTDATTTSASG